MKCPVCKHEGNDFINIVGTINYDRVVFEKENTGTNTKVWIYGCPKCGTVQFEGDY